MSRRLSSLELTDCMPAVSTEQDQAHQGQITYAAILKKVMELWNTKYKQYTCNTLASGVSCPNANLGLQLTCIVVWYSFSKTEKVIIEAKGKIFV